MPASTYYILEDETRVSTGGKFSCFIPTANFYWQLGLISNHEVNREKERLELGDPEGYIQTTKELLDKIGVPAERYRFQWASFDAETLKQLEQECIAANLIDAGEEKGSWTKEDEIYLIFAWEYEEEIPVLSELMCIDSVSCLDRITGNFPITAIYSSRGLESIRTSKYYQFQETGEKLSLIEFEKAAQTVEEKLNSILGTSRYQVMTATLFERVKRYERSISVKL